MAAAKKKPDEKTEDRCPNCGYCPHCGQSTKRWPPFPPIYPQPIPVPYRRPIYWDEGVQQPYRVWYGTTVSTGGERELRSVSTEERSGQEERRC